MKDTITIGSMLWVTRGEASGDMRGDVMGMLENGLTCARIFLTVSSVKNDAGEWDFSTWDSFFDICDEEGLKLTVTLGCLGTPFELQDCRYTCEDENWIIKVRRKVLEDTRLIVERYKGHKCVHSWILQNEPSLPIAPDRNTLPLFREWLLEKAYDYDIASIRSAYLARDVFSQGKPEVIHRERTEEEKATIRKEYALISDRIGKILPDGSGTLPGVNAPGWCYCASIDWGCFNAYLMQERLGENARLIRAIDPVHPTTLNPDNVACQFPSEGGRDLYAQGKLVDFLGCSCHVSWHSVRFAEDRIHQSVSMFSDMIRSATSDPEENFWITELQAGTNYFSGNRAMCPTGNDIRHWLWEAVSSGARGMIYWLYRARPAHFEGLEWSLMDQKGQPSRRSRATLEVKRLIESERELFDIAVPEKFEGAILHSYDSINLSHAEVHGGVARGSAITDPRNDHMVRDALCGAYTLLQDMGRKCGFVGEDDLDRLKDYRFVIAPNTYGLTKKTIAKLAEYVENGGILIADGLFAAKDRYGFRTEGEAAELVDRLFGRRVDDWFVDRGRFSFGLSEGGALPAWYLTCIWENEDGLEVLARDSEGSASVIGHTAGKGRAYYIGTQFFQNYFAHESIDGYADFLNGLLPEDERELRLKNPGTTLRMKTMTSGKRRIIVLMNRAEACEAVMGGSFSGIFRDIRTGERISVERDARIAMDKMQIRVMAEE